MVKMGSDYTTPINCRLRGIVVTPDNKHLFVEVGCAYSPDIKHTSLTQKEYNLKYPNPQYVSVDFCFRVDIPEDRYKNSTKEYTRYIRENLFEIPYTEKGIIEFLKKLNNAIDGIEFVNDYYIDKYCEENGFYELYDDRLKHNYKLLSIKYLDPDIKYNSNIIYKYTCYAKDGTEFSEIREERDNINNISTIIISFLGILLGIIISMLIDYYLPDKPSISSDKKLYKVGFISMIAIILHNIPEGIATFVATNSDITLGISLAIAIAMHNIPEGISISVPIYYSTNNKKKALLYTGVSALSEPFGAFLAYIFLKNIMNDLILGILFSLIAGIMLQISFCELLPTARRYNNTKYLIIFFLVGVLFMLMKFIL